MIYEKNSTRQTRNLIGQIPEPDELYGREEFIDLLWQLIGGNNILLLAPRRFGKSGVMRHILMRPRSGFLPLSFELEDVDSPEEFVWRVTRELLKHDVLQSLLSKAS
jgi:AAA+ ATPase superfamily predicted ATPase